MILARLPIITSSAAWDNLQLVTEKAVRIGLIGMLINDVQLLNILFIVVTELVLNNGTEVSDEQLLNILLILVTEIVLNNGTEVSDEQLLNILLILVTEIVLNNGTEVSE